MSGGPDWARVKTVFQSALEQPDDLRASFVAYAPDESGRFEVYVQSFDDAGGKTLVSTRGAPSRRGAATVARSSTSRRTGR